MPDQIRRSVDVLFFRVASQFDASRMQPSLCLARIERIVNILRDGGSFLTDAGARMVIGHFSFNVPRQLIQFLVAPQRIVIFAFYPFSLCAVTFGAFLQKNLAPGRSPFRALNSSEVDRDKNQANASRGTTVSKRLRSQTFGIIQQRSLSLQASQ